MKTSKRWISYNFRQVYLLLPEILNGINSLRHIYENKFNMNFYAVCQHTMHDEMLKNEWIMCCFAMLLRCSFGMSDLFAMENKLMTNYFLHGVEQ